jgi:hypothetical protein
VNNAPQHEAAPVKLGRWTVLLSLGTDGKKRKRSRFLCRCECGTERVVRGDILRSGISASCGCLGREHSAIAHVTHGYTRGGRSNGNPTYVSWKAMKQRCSATHGSKHRWYAAQGVTVCERWARSFAAFVADMGERPATMTLDRINPCGNYEPSNCRWADATTQNNNQRRHCEADA